MNKAKGDQGIHLKQKNKYLEINLTEAVKLYSEHYITLM